MIKYRPYSNPNTFNPNANWKQRTKKRLILNQTYAERVFYDVYETNFSPRIIPQKIIRVPGYVYFIDFYIPKFKIAIEIDGGYHQTQKEKDAARDERLLDYRNILTVRLTNEEVLIDCFNKIMGIFELGMGSGLPSKRKLTAIPHYDRPTDGIAA